MVLNGHFMTLTPIKTNDNWTNNSFWHFSPNYATISGLIAGEEYKVHILAESAFGRNSSQLSFVQSLYTDVVVISNDLQTHRIQTDVQFESGLGSTVTMELICQDLPLNWKQKKAFQLV